jgi:hypothetical protein
MMKRKAGLSILVLMTAIALYTILPFVVIMLALFVSDYSVTLFEGILVIGGPLTRIIPVGGFLWAMYVIWFKGSRPASGSEYDDAA